MEREVAIQVTVLVRILLVHRSLLVLALISI